MLKKETTYLEDVLEDIFTIENFNLDRIILNGLSIRPAPSGVKEKINRIKDVVLNRESLESLFNDIRNDEYQLLLKVANEGIVEVFDTTDAYYFLAKGILFPLNFNLSTLNYFMPEDVRNTIKSLNFELIQKQANENDSFYNLVCAQCGFYGVVKVQDVFKLLHDEKKVEFNEERKAKLIKKSQKIDGVMLKVFNGIKYFQYTDPLLKEVYDEIFFKIVNDHKKVEKKPMKYQELLDFHHKDIDSYINQSEIFQQMKKELIKHGFEENSCAIIAKMHLESFNLSKYCECNYNNLEKLMESKNIELTSRQKEIIKEYSYLAYRNYPLWLNHGWTLEELDNL